jgi:hypothetical protein
MADEAPNSANRVVLTAALLMAVVALTSSGWLTISRIHQDRVAMIRATTACASRATISDREKCETATLAVRGVLASENSADAAIWQTTFNFFGILGLAATIYLSRKSWWEAKRSADATKAGLEITYQSRADDRRKAQARLAVARASIEYVEGGRNSAAFLRLCIQLKNIGPSPCTKITYDLRARLQTIDANDIRQTFQVHIEGDSAVALTKNAATPLIINMIDPKPIGESLAFYIDDGTMYSFDTKELYIYYDAFFDNLEKMHLYLQMPFGLNTYVVAGKGRKALLHVNGA